MATGRQLLGIATDVAQAPGAGRLSLPAESAGLSGSSLESNVDQ